MQPIQPDDKRVFLCGRVGRLLLSLNILMSFVYFLLLTFFFERGDPLLFGLLIAGEVFHVWQVVGYSLTVWGHAWPAVEDPAFDKPVAVFITVAGEPVEIVERTARAALGMKYPRFRVYILNDGYVAKKDNWREIIRLEQRLDVKVLTRRTPGGAKAGNINHALQVTRSPFVAIFDADHAPHRDFLRKTMGYFIDARMGFVQTPQYYHNASQNGITRTAWDQQTIFFGAIMQGKNSSGSAFMCGTNMVLRRAALESAGGMCEFSIAEDFLTSLFIHAKGWKSWYVPEVLAEGLAPEDFLSYYKQQFRWARGSLEVIFRYNPLFVRRMRLAHRFQYLVSASYYMSGLVVLVDALLPLAFLYAARSAIVTSTMDLAFVFLPYIALNLYVLQKTGAFSYTFQAIAFSMSACFVFSKAVVLTVLRRKATFAVTSKTALSGNFLRLVLPHIVYLLLVVGGIIVGIRREGLSASLLSNAAWAVLNCVLFVPFIVAAAPRSLQVRKRRPVPLPVAQEAA